MRSLQKSRTQMILTQSAKVGREPAGGGEGVGVVVAPDSTAADEGVFLELSSVLTLAK